MSIVKTGSFFGACCCHYYRVAMFNQDHTVGDIRNFLRKAQPGGAPSAYTLMTAPPLPTTLSDNSATLKDAGLLNAVILQKI